MCEIKAFLKKDKVEELILEDIDFVKVKENGEISLRNIFGEEKIIKAKIKEINLSKHKIILIPL